VKDNRAVVRIFIALLTFSFDMYMYIYIYMYMYMCMYMYMYIFFCLFTACSITDSNTACLERSSHTFYIKYVSTLL